MNTSATGVAEQVTVIMRALAKTLDATKAGEWQAVLRFSVGDAGTHTLTVADGVCTHDEGATNEPTCVVTFGDAATLIGMLDGSVNPQQAFMGGKLSATNLGDLMKLPAAFDFAAAARSAAAESGAAESDPVQETLEAKVARVLAQIDRAYLPERAKGWVSTLNLEIVGAGVWTVVVSGETVHSEVGGSEEAKGTITFESAALFMELVAGEKRPEQAFMSGAIKTTDFGEMMAFAKAFDLERAAKVLDEGATPPSSKPDEPGLNLAYIGRTYDNDVTVATLEETSAYALATADENPRYLDAKSEGGQVAPPLFVVRPTLMGLLSALADPGLRADLVNMVHGEQDMRFLSVVRPGDALATSAVIDAIEERSTGQLLTVRQLVRREGELVSDISSQMYFRDRTRPRGPKKEKQPEPSRDVLFTEVIEVALDQPERYAAASGDSNPLHVRPDVAKAAGFPGVILHGMCTMAFAQKAIVDGALGGTPEGLKRLKVRFSKVVFPGDTLTTRVWMEDEGEAVNTLGFEVINQRDERVITAGLAEVDASHYGLA